MTISDKLGDGGPVFPLQGINNDDLADAGFPDITHWTMGLSKRELFAVAALAGGLEHGVRDDMDLKWWHDPRMVAKRAFAIADAMLIEAQP
jgi:hypothetical protein